MATLYQVGETWYINYVNAQGVRVRGSLHTKSKQEAENALDIIVSKVRLEALTGQSEPARQQCATLNDFSETYLNWHQSEYPDSHYRVKGQFVNYLLPYFGDLPLDEIAPFIAEQYKIERKQAGLAAATIKKELDALKAALNRAVKWELLNVNRIAGVAAPRLLDSKPPRFYSKDELQAIYDSAIKYGALWKFVANTGMRRHEVMKARREHIVDGAIRILSTESARTKSGKWRPVPLSPGALSALDELGDDYLAPRMHLQSLSRAFVNDAKLAGVGGSLHDLRHTFCSMLVMGGVDLRTVQELAGHARFETTLRYAHLSKQHLSNAVSKLDI